ncbi:MAG: hypothetical protein PSY12_09910 [bacterium]|nr:hypothetical protein [bacterium]
MAPVPARSMAGTTIWASCFSAGRNHMSDRIVLPSGARYGTIVKAPASLVARIDG